MGSGASHKKVKMVDSGNQMPSIENRSYESPPPSKSPLFQRVQRKPTKHRSSPQEEVFDLDTNIEDYSSIWDHDTKLSTTIQKSIKSNPNHFDHHQKEILNNKSNKKNALTHDSTRIESLIDTQTHGCINLSTSDKIDELILSLNRVHTQLDQTIKQRTEQISTETESILSHILNETQLKQQRLLNYAKERQSKQDENYRQLLEEYISRLDQIKAKEIAELQNQLQIYRDQIFEESQLKILTVNDQANLIKSKILQNEQQQAAERIDSIIAQIQKISTDEKLQHLGTEIITKTNITTNTNVGTKAPGQNSIFNSEEKNSSPQQSTKRNSKSQNIK